MHTDNKNILETICTYFEDLPDMEKGRMLGYTERIAEEKKEKNRKEENDGRSSNCI